MRFGFGSRVAISPNGLLVAYVADVGGTSQLAVRPLDRFDVRLLPGTEGAEVLFFSPDGAWLGFVTTDSELKKVALDGSPPIGILSEGLSRPSGIAPSWGDDGFIVVSGDYNSGLRRVSADGGALELITTPSLAAGDLGHVMPAVLPGATALLFVTLKDDLLESELRVMSLETGEVRTLVKGAAFPRYVQTGHVIYAADGLMALPFDLDRLEPTGRPVPITEPVMVDLTRNGNHLSISSTGTLLSVRANATTRGLQSPEGRLAPTWVDRRGEEVSLGLAAGAYYDPRLSPDGSRLALRQGAAVDNPDVWVYDLDEGGGSIRFTFDLGIDYSPVFSPNGEQIVFASTRDGPPNLYRKAADGSGAVERLTTSPNTQIPYSFHPDGQRLVFGESGPSGVWDVSVLSLPENTSQPILQTDAYEAQAMLSPDGQWLAYTSDETGQREVYVRPFPDVNGGQWPISAGGGTEPLWAPNGTEVFYRNGSTVLSVAIETEGAPTLGNPEELFPAPNFVRQHQLFATYDVAPDSERFLMLKEAEPVDLTLVTDLILIENWFEELKARVPTE